LWKRHRRYSGDGTWDQVLAELLADADSGGLVDWALSVDSTVIRAHQHAATLARHTGGGVELREPADRAG
jgi:transposase